MALPTVLKDHYRGALLGVVIGDCLGSFWENSSWKKTIDIDDVQRKIDEQVEQSVRRHFRISYTDDTTMTFGMAESLLSCREFDPKDMAKRFSADYFRDPRRGYGQSISTVFTKLRFNVDDVYRPAAEQFDGKGSFGNGSAMRVTPATLFAYKNKDTLIEVARNSARLTHGHPSAILGAILQAFAVHTALDLRGTPIDPLSFIESLLSIVVPLEDAVEAEVQHITDPPVSNSDDQPPSSTAKKPVVLPSYQSVLLQIKEFVRQPRPPSRDQIMQTIGNGVKACEAVPCAIYAFLHCHKLSFKYLIPYAISLGGDTDTIASMAGAIGGAYWGKACIPSEWVGSVEGGNHAIKLADGLHALYNNPQYLVKF